MSDDRRLRERQQGDEATVLTWLQNALRDFRLAWRLLLDNRVPLWTKIVPPAALAYVLSPIDILPDFPPMGLNQLDDLAVVVLGLKLFIELAPPDVVRDHLKALGAHIEEWRVVDGDDSSVLEGRHEIHTPDREDGQGRHAAG